MANSPELAFFRIMQVGADSPGGADAPPGQARYTAGLHGPECLAGADAWLCVCPEKVAVSREAASNMMDSQIFAGLLGPDAGVAVDAQADFLPDLQLDHIIGSACAEDDAQLREPHPGASSLRACFLRPLRDPACIAYRQAVMRELEDAALATHFRSFADGMRRVRAWQTSATLTDVNPLQAARWGLEAALQYLATLRALDLALAGTQLQSAGLRGWRNWLADHLAGPAFGALEAAARALQTELEAATFNVYLRGNEVTVSACGDEVDYSAAVERTFARLRGAQPGEGASVAGPAPLNPVEEEILARVAALHPQVFTRLAAFRSQHGGFVDATVRQFDADLRFYFAWLDYLAPLRAAGLPFCYPQLSVDDKSVELHDTFDLALGAALVREGQAVVGNDVELLGDERLLVITGPNQAGKTGVARAIGQAHHLAALGCAVPGRSARLYLCDRIFTHFEREENLARQQSKLEDDLVRMHAILAAATPRSLVILNEAFASTTLQDATALARCVMAELSRRDMLTVFVTFIDELAAFDAHTVSLVGVMGPAEQGGEAVRTYRFCRRHADGRAYALAIAEKYGLSYARILERLPA